MEKRLEKIYKNKKDIHKKEIWIEKKHILKKNY